MLFPRNMLSITDSNQLRFDSKTPQKEHYVPLG